MQVLKQSPVPPAGALHSAGRGSGVLPWVSVTALPLAQRRGLRDRHLGEDPVDLFQCVA